MLEKGLVRQKLYEKYIEPTKREREKYVGIEIEMPILNLNKAAVDFEVVYGLTQRFMDYFHFEVDNRDEEGNISAAKHRETGDILSYDCSYNNLELSLGREKELHALQKRFTTYYTYIQQELEKYNYTLTGFGVNPYRNYNHNIPIPNGRYRMLFHHLNSYPKYADMQMYFHGYPGYGLFSSASQVQLDVFYDELPKVIRAFSKVEPIKALLFSNSVLLDEQEDIICCRDMFWENSTHGINPHNIGMFECDMESVEELLTYIESTSIYCVERDGRYINFEPIPVLEYYRKNEIVGEYYENGEYHEIKIVPTIEDLNYLRTFKFEDLTFRGTVEFRSVCCQPIGDSMTVAAFHLGLKEMLEELDVILETDKVLYHHGYTATELRKMFVKREIPSFVEEDELYDLAKKIVDLAREGLVKRGYGEEEYLEPLYGRIKKRTNPARSLLDRRDAGVSLEDVIREYSLIG